MEQGIEQSLVNFLFTQWPTVVVLAVGWYFIVRYFMGVVERKDTQNQSNLDKFIGLVDKTHEFMQKQIQSIEGISPKLSDMHNDIKEIKNRK